MKKPIATGLVFLLQRCRGVSHMNPKMQRWLLNNLLPQSNMQNVALSNATGNCSSHACGFINHTHNLIKITSLVSFWKWSRSLWIWDEDDHDYIMTTKFKAIECQTKRMCTKLIFHNWNVMTGWWMKTPEIVVHACNWKQKLQNINLES
jgi:hypothetical protein